jgi:hypothetical protein
MTRATTIHRFCRECVSNSPKELVLCTGFNCPLYPFRLGNSPNAKAYKQAMPNAKKRWPKEWAENEEWKKSCPPPFGMGHKSDEPYLDSQKEGSFTA